MRIGDDYIVGFFFLKRESLILDTNFKAVQLCLKVDVKGLTWQQNKTLPDKVRDNICVKLHYSSILEFEPLVRAIDNELKDCVTNFLSVSPLLLQL